MELNGAQVCNNTFYQFKKIFAISSFGLLSDCDCSQTSLLSERMQDAPSLSPLIPKDLNISAADSPVSIKIALGYDTISYSCGNMDGRSFCSSFNDDTSVNFHDVKTGKKLTNPFGIFSWDQEKNNLLIEATNKDKLGLH